MTHDPLCPVVTISKVIDRVLVFPWTDLSTTNLGKTVTYEEGECVCDLIARVREDERSKSERAGALMFDAIGIASMTNYDAGLRDGRAAALRDAVEAVNGLPFLQYDQPAGVLTDSGVASFSGQYVNRGGAVAAIEALGPLTSRVAHTCPDNNCCMGDPE